MWIRAFRGTPITPTVLRDLELWEIGVLLDGDLEPPGPRKVYVQKPLAPGEKPTGPRLVAAD